MKIDIKQLDIQIKTVKLQAKHIKQMTWVSPNRLLNHELTGLGYVVISNKKYGIVTDGRDYYSIHMNIIKLTYDKRLVLNGSEMFRNYSLMVEDRIKIKEKYDILVLECYENHIYV